MNYINNSRVDTTNRMLENQNRRYHKYNISRMDSKPIFCTYYNQDRGESTVSQGLGMIYEKSGVNTPLRFNKINNVPIYAFKEFNRETNRTEYKGINLDVNNEGLIPSSTFEPMAGDFLEIRVGDNVLMFEVSYAAPTSLMNAPHFKINYSYGAEKMKDPQSIKDVYDKVIGEYDYIIDNVGTNKVTILDVKTVSKIKELTSIYARINHKYLKEYYLDRYNILVYSKMCYDNPEHPMMMHYYCPMLVEFQRRLKPIMYQFDANLSIELLLTHETMGYFEFEDTVYGDLSNDAILEQEAFHSFDLAEFDEGGRYLELVKTFPQQRYLTILNSLMKEEEFVMNYGYPSEKFIVDYIYKQFKSKDRITEDVISTFKELHKVVINKDAEVIQLIKDIVTNRDNIIEYTRNYKVKHCVEDYLFVPIVLYFLKAYIIDLQKDPKYLLDNVPKGER